MPGASGSPIGSCCVSDCTRRFGSANRCNSTSASVISPFALPTAVAGISLTALLAGGALAAFALAARWLGRGMDAHRLAALGLLIGLVAFSAVIFAAPLGSPLLFRAGATLIGLGGGLFAVSTLTVAMGLEQPGQIGLDGVDAVGGKRQCRRRQAVGRGEQPRAADGRRGWRNHRRGARCPQGIRQGLAIRLRMRMGRHASPARGRAGPRGATPGGADPA